MPLEIVFLEPQNWRPLKSRGTKRGIHKRGIHEKGKFPLF